MPVEIPFDWREDETSLVFVLDARGVKAKNVSVSICDVYVKVNVPPALFEVDLLHEIDAEHPKTRCRVSPNKVTLTLQKQERQLWGEFRLVAPKAELRSRREVALRALQEREEGRLQKRQEFKQEMLKQGEHAQWRLDSQNRETIERWEKEEKEKWEAEVYRSFDEDTGALLDSEPIIEEVTEEDRGSAAAKEEPRAPQAAATPPAEVEEAVRQPEELAVVSQEQEELEETEEYVPEVRDNPGKIGIRFTMRPRPGVPVRDRGRKAAPFPKDAPKAEHQPPMLAGDEEDETDPIWLKDKGDKLMTLGDYQGAYNAYTEALKLASNARCFANRAVAALYLGNFEQCLEDCNRSIQILDFRNKPRPGEISHTADPEDEKVRARVEVRMGVAYLWLGAFKKAEAHFEKALTSEGLESEEARQVRSDLDRVQAARQALQQKEQADQTMRGAGTADEAVEKALSFYNEAEETSQKECAVVYANRCQAHLRLGQLRDCLKDADAALQALRRWPGAAKAPKAPARPAGLEPPYLDDPTFVHPDQQNQGEREWLMKHNGGSVKELPGLPDEYEWIKDVAEKDEDAWIAVKKRMTKATIDAIKRTTSELQDALYLRSPVQIRQQIEVAMEQNKAREGPSSKAIQQAEDYAQKLEEHEKEQQAQKESDAAERLQEAQELDLEEALAPRRAGRGQAGFGPKHPLQQTRRRLFVKILLRRARAFELLGQHAECLDDLNAVLAVEPANREALEARRRHGAPQDASAAPPPPEGEASPEEQAEAVPAPVAAEPAPAPGPALGPGGPKEEDEDEEGDAGADHASTTTLIGSAAEYMKRGDYTSALQICHYARRTCRSWESPMQEVKVLANTTLCLQQLPGRLPELIQACNEALRRISEVQTDPSCQGQVDLLRMEAAVRSRRSSAYAQQRRMDESAEDAAKAKALLSQMAESGSR